MGADVSTPNGLSSWRLVPRGFGRENGLLYGRCASPNSGQVDRSTDAVDLAKGVKTMPEVDQEIGGTRPVEFERDLRELENLVERFTSKKVELGGRDTQSLGR